MPTTTYIIWKTHDETGVTAPVPMESFTERKAADKVVKQLAKDNPGWSYEAREVVVGAPENETFEA